MPGSPEPCHAVVKPFDNPEPVSASERESEGVRDLTAGGWLIVPAKDRVWAARSGAMALPRGAAALRMMFPTPQDVPSMTPVSPCPDQTEVTLTQMMAEGLPAAPSVPAAQATSPKAISPTQPMSARLLAARSEPRVFARTAADSPAAPSQADTIPGSFPSMMAILLGAPRADSPPTGPQPGGIDWSGIDNGSLLDTVFGLMPFGPIPDPQAAEYDDASMRSAPVSGFDNTSQPSVYQNIAAGLVDPLSEFELIDDFVPSSCYSQAPQSPPTPSYYEDAQSPTPVFPLSPERPAMMDVLVVEDDEEIYQGDAGQESGGLVLPIKKETII